MEAGETPKLEQEILEGDPKVLYLILFQLDIKNEKSGAL